MPTVMQQQRFSLVDTFCTVFHLITSPACVRTLHLNFSATSLQLLSIDFSGSSHDVHVSSAKTRMTPEQHSSPPFIRFWGVAI